MLLDLLSRTKKKQEKLGITQKPIIFIHVCIKASEARKQYTKRLKMSPTEEVDWIGRGFVF
jgi:hypothetical protein